MANEAKQNLAMALKCRFEADALLGAAAIPVKTPKAGRPRGRAPAASAGGPQAAAQASPEPVTSPATARAEVASEEIERRQAALSVIDEKEVKVCRKCGLTDMRTKTVYGVGSPAARIMFVGEAPGHDEDVTGEPFVGRAGKLLTDMIQKGMGLRREDVYICNVLKCRPPDNRTPAGDEIAACRDYLWRQIEIIQPELIIALGAPAAQTLLGTKEGIGRLRGRFHDFYPSGTSMIGESIPLLPTFHPAYLLRSPGEKVKAWEDLKLAMAKLGIPLPKRG